MAIGLPRGQRCVCFYGVSLHRPPQGQPTKPKPSGRNSLRGLAYGPLLKFDEQDILGKTVNTAAVAGEDTAGPWEVLIAESALEQVKLEALLEPTSHIIGGEKISCWMPVKPE